MPETKMDWTKKYPMVLPDGQGQTIEVRQLVHLNQVIDHPRIEIGEFTYYHNFVELTDYAHAIAPYLFPASPEKLKIGKFCQLAHGARFITSSANHDRRGFSTYPFMNFMMDSDTSQEDIASLLQVPQDKGDTTIGNDVWMGFESIVMPGITVGDGAIVGARSVVVADVQPYTVVGGNPARKLKDRFDPTVTAELIAIQWWNWPIEKIEAKITAIRSQDISQLK